MTDMTSHDEIQTTRGSAGEVFAAFLKLGLTSFGGPIARLGYFRNELVLRRKWIDEKGYADLVALSQFLPGPASSQVGFALGLLRGGPLGALAAWTAFTLPSAILLVLFAYGAAAFGGPIGGGIITGLKIVAVAIVAQALWGMARNLCPDRERATIALGAVLIIVLFSGALGQVAAIAAGAAAGLIFCRNHQTEITRHIDFPVSRGFGATSLALFFALLFGLPIVASAMPSQGLSVFDAFYRAGSLVFGGGHVVLPLLETEVVRSGWVSHDQFLAGYGAAQAVPGPLFTFAAYLGTVLGPEPNGLIGAGITSSRGFPAGIPDPHRRHSFLGRLPQTRERTSPDARRQCRRRGYSRRGAIRSGLHQRYRRLLPVLAGTHLLRSADGMESAAMDRGARRRSGRRAD